MFQVLLHKRNSFIERVNWVNKGIECKYIFEHMCSMNLLKRRKYKTYGRLFRGVGFGLAQTQHFGKRLFLLLIGSFGIFYSIFGISWHFDTKISLSCYSCLTISFGFRFLNGPRRLNWFVAFEDVCAESICKKMSFFVVLSRWRIRKKEHGMYR